MQQTSATRVVHGLEAIIDAAAEVPHRHVERHGPGAGKVGVAVDRDAGVMPHRGDPRT